MTTNLETDLGATIDDTLKLLTTLADMRSSSMEDALTVAVERWDAYSEALGHNVDEAHRIHPGHGTIYPLDEDFAPATAEDAIDSIVVLLDFLVASADATSGEVVQLVSDAIARHDAPQR